MHFLHTCLNQYRTGSLREKKNLMKHQETQQYLKYQIQKEQREWFRRKYVTSSTIASQEVLNYLKQEFQESIQDTVKVLFGVEQTSIQIHRSRSPITFHIRVRLVVQSTFSKNSRNLNAASIELTNIRTFF